MRLGVAASTSLLVTVGRAGNFGSSGDPTTVEGDSLTLGSPGGVGGAGPCIYVTILSTITTITRRRR